MDIVHPNSKEASIIKRMIGERGFAVVNLGDRHALIQILDDSDAQQVLNAPLSDPAEIERTRESIRQRKASQGIALADVKSKYRHD